MAGPLGSLKHIRNKKVLSCKIKRLTVAMRQPFYMRFCNDVYVHKKSTPFRQKRYHGSYEE